MKKWKSIKEILQFAKAGQETGVRGRIRNMRYLKNRTFIDLVDYDGKVQIVLEDGVVKDYEALIAELAVGAYIQAAGTVQFRKHEEHEDTELLATEIEVVGRSTLNVTSPWDMNGLDESEVKKMFASNALYVANPERAAILRIKSNFMNEMHKYFQRENFTYVEPPIITNRILYQEENAISAEVHGEKVYLSQCATFELEPLALVFGKVYTISPAFRNEKSGSKRHLAEYTHVKAEYIFANLDDLMELASEAIYTTMEKTIQISQPELDKLGVHIDLEKLLPRNHEFITYDEALEITHKEGSKTKWGEGLKKVDEVILTKHMGDRYVWVKYPPFESEGFPYKRLPSNRDLSMTCDLIAPNGAGEMVGVAEKITDPEELIQNLIEKGHKKNIRHYWNYIALREYGMPPHGGIGAAPERILYGLLGLTHIRLTKAWPRYPGKKVISAENAQVKDFGSDRLKDLIEKYDLS